MKNRFLSLFTLALICVSQASSVDTAAGDASTPDLFMHLAGVRPLTIKMNTDVTIECLRNFTEFRRSQKEKREKINEWKILEAYTDGIIENPSGAMYVGMVGESLRDIRDWISKPATGGASPHMAGAGTDRVLCVSLEVLAETLSIRTKKPITSAEIAAYLTNAKEKIEPYYLLKHFAKTVLALPHHEIDGLHSWVTGKSHHAAMPNSLDLVFKLINAKVGRDITADFARFAEEYNEKKERILLKEDFDAFTMGSTPGATPAMPVMIYHSHEILIENGMEFSRPTFPKGFDVSVALAAAKHTFLGALIAEVGDRFRVFNRFVVSSQGLGVEYPIHTSFYDFSRITITDGLIHQDGEVLNTADTIWALSPQGEFCIYPQKKSSILAAAHHNYFFQKDGVGLPIACGGHVEVRNGKISKIDRNSGHYMPCTLQLILAVSYFNELGIVSDDVVLNQGGYTTGLNSLSDVLSIAGMIEFA
mgnify:CR=1 FL=1